MLRGLLAVTLERIESLHSFYSTEYVSIEEKSKKGCHVNSFGFMLDTYLRILSTGLEEEKNSKSFLNMQENLKNHIEVIDLCEQDGSKKITYRFLNPNDLKLKGYEIDTSIATKRFRQFAEMPEIHGDNTLIMLITRFEEFVSRLLGQIYFMFPQKYLDNQDVKFSEIAGIGVDEVRSNIVDREIDHIMRKSYTEWFDLFRSHGMCFNACEDAMKSMIEIYARRNIIVHNSGIVNKSYLKMVPHTSAQLGEKLSCNKEYISSAFSAVTTVIYTIAIEAARLMGKETEEYLEEIFRKAFDELQKKNYQVSSNIFLQLSTHKGLDSSMKLLSQMNNWIARIELGDGEQARKEVELLDVSALSSEFLLAKLILLEKYEHAARVLADMFKQNRMSSHEVETWPLFIHFRKTEVYEEFKKAHSEAFQVSAVEIDQKPSDEDTENAKTISASIETSKEDNGNECNS